MSSEAYEENNKVPKFIRVIYELLEVVIPAFVIVVFINIFMFRQTEVHQTSMTNTLQEGDRVIILPLVPSYDELKIGDIIVSHPSNFEEPIIKRLIAKEGQTVDVRAGIVYVDDEMLSEPYIRNYKGIGTYTPVYNILSEIYEDLKTEDLMQFPLTVPEQCVFAMGDNRLGSVDSRYKKVGFIKREDIIGKAALRIFPFNKFGLL